MNLYIVIKAQTRSCKNSTDFYGKDASEIGFNYFYIAIILIDSILEKDGKYHLQVKNKK